MKPMISAQQLLEIQHQRDTLSALLPEIAETYKVNAKLKKEKYNALIAEGFTDEQAMQIVIAGNENISL